MARHVRAMTGEQPSRHRPLILAPMGLAPGMTRGGRCQRVRISDAWYYSAGLCGPLMIVLMFIRMPLAITISPGCKSAGQAPVHFASWDTVAVLRPIIGGLKVVLISL